MTKREKTIQLAMKAAREVYHREINDENGDEDTTYAEIIPFDKTRELYVSSYGLEIYFTLVDKGEPDYESDIYGHCRLNEDDMRHELNYIINCNTDWKQDQPMISAKEAIKKANKLSEREAMAYTPDKLVIDKMTKKDKNSVKDRSPVLFSDYDEIEAKNYRDTDKTLFDYLEESGFDYLLPEPERDNDPYIPDITEEDIFGWPEDEDDEDAAFRARRERPLLSYTGKEWSEDEDEDEHKNMWIYDIKETFKCQDLSNEEFKHSSPWELLGITAKQFHGIDANELSDISFPKFVDRIKDPRTIEILPDGQQRIKYAILMANLDVYGMYDKDDIKYVLKIATKNTLNNAIQIMQLYIDYMHIRNDAIRFNDEHIANAENPEHPYYEYPAYPKQSALRDLHDKATRDAVLWGDLIGQANQALLNEHIERLIKTPNYMRFLFKDDKYSVIAAESIEDLKYEGKILKHCIGTYGEKFANGTSYIYFIRRNKNLKAPFYSAEITPQIRHYELSQLYTYKDGTEKTEEFKAFIQKWIDVKKLRVHCTI